MNRTVTAGALALVSAATCLVLAPTASAAPQACVKANLTTGEGQQNDNSTARKSGTSSCNDLNLTFSDDQSQFNYDYYAGRLQRSNGTWFTCARGFANGNPDIPVYDGNHSINDSKYWLCTDVAANTRFGVASLFDGGDKVTITH
ncbi:hypothetical protein ACWCPM_07625 [Streptomyces sp. NPDC002309]